MIEIKTHGIVLGAKHFHDCVAFFRDVAGLPIWFEKVAMRNNSLWDEEGNCCQQRMKTGLPAFARVTNVVWPYCSVISTATWSDGF
jgi:hypothetical protein